MSEYTKIINENQYIPKCPKCNSNISILKSQPSIFSKEYYYPQCTNCGFKPIKNVYNTIDDAITNLNYSIYQISTCPFCDNTKTERKIIEKMIELTDSKKLYYTVRCTKCGTSSNFADSPEDACNNWNQEKFTIYCHDCKQYYAFSYHINKDNKDTYSIKCLNCSKSTDNFPTWQEAILAWEKNYVSNESESFNSVQKQGISNTVIEKSGKKYLVYDNKVFCQIDNMDESISMDKHLAYLRDFAEICIEHCDNPSMVKQYAQIILDQVNKIQSIRDDVIANYKHPNFHDFNPTLIELNNVLMEENKFLFSHRRQICPPYMKEYDVEPCGPTDGRSNHTKDRNCRACWHQVFLKMQRIDPSNNCFDDEVSE